ncbi:MAG: DUF481 domain-containing protein [Thermodesulfobacteriota bacterium]
MHDTGEIALVNTSGNTEVLTVSAKNKLTVDLSPADQLMWKLAALYGKDSGVKNAESYATDLRWDHAFTENTYGFLLGGWLQDKFKGFDDRWWGGAGAGYKLVNTQRNLLRAELGANYAAEYYTNSTDQQFPEGRAFAEYTHFFSTRTKFVQSLEYLLDFSESRNYKLNSQTALLVAINDIFSLKAGYEIYYDNAPTPADLDKTDTRLSMALVVDY